MYQKMLKKALKNRWFRQKIVILIKKHNFKSPKISDFWKKVKATTLHFFAIFAHFLALFWSDFSFLGTFWDFLVKISLWEASKRKKVLWNTDFSTFCVFHVLWIFWKSEICDFFAVFGFTDLHARRAVEKLGGGGLFDA